MVTLVTLEPTDRKDQRTPVEIDGLGGGPYGLGHERVGAVADQRETGGINAESTGEELDLVLADGNEPIGPGEDGPFEGPLQQPELGCKRLELPPVWKVKTVGRSQCRAIASESGGSAVCTP